MMTFHLVRHAEKEGDGDRLTGRMPNVSLSPAGRDQAERLAVSFRGETVDRLIASPVIRAQETAAPLARVLRCPVEIADALEEMDLGDWTGRTPTELAGDVAFRRFNAFRGLNRVPGGESMLEVQQRVVTAMLGWRDLQPDATVVLVSHAEPIRAALAYFSGTPLDLWWRIEVGLASVSTIELSPEHVRILRQNDRSAQRDHARQHDPAHHAA